MFIQQTFKNNLPTLYLVGSPIGNLADFSFRAIEVLKTVDAILCEDTRTSLTLLNKYEIKKPLLSLHKYNEIQRSEQISDLLNQNQNLALISDAGVPTISDPGANLVNSLRWTKNVAFNVSVVNAGPAYIHALASSGFINPTNYFYGFIKNKNEASKQAELKKIFEQFSNLTIIFYESVHRIKATIQLLATLLDSEIKLTLNRELTKINEEIIYGTIEEIHDYVNSPDFIEKGEFVIVIDYQINKSTYDDQALLDLLKQKVSSGLKVKQAVKEVSDTTKINKNYLYELYIKNK